MSFALSALHHRIKQLHDEAHTVAFDYYLRKGIVHPRLATIMQATSSLEAFAAYTQKFNPDQPRVPAGSTGGGQWTDGDGTDTIEDLLNQNPLLGLGTALFAIFGGIAEGLGAIGDAVGGAVDAGAEDAVGVAAEDASAPTQNIIDTVAPDGAAIGDVGSKPWFRTLPTGSDEAEQMLQDLRQGGTLNTPTGYPGIGYTFPDGSFVGYRPVSTSGPPTIDINVASLRQIVRKIKFLGGEDE